MSKTLILQMDEPESFNPATDTTMALALEAQERGYALWYYTPRQLACVNGEVAAPCRPIRFFKRPAKFFERDEAQQRRLEEADIILIRQNPPYNMEYLGCTWLLEELRRPKIFNHPGSIRNRPEKLFPLEFPQYTPQTCISADVDTLMAFRREHPDTVIKPLYGFGGQAVYHLPPQSQNFESLIVQLLSSSPEPLILQPYLPEVMREEKRILLINGKVAAAYNRIPAEGDFRSNGAVGGSAAPTELTARQREIAESVGDICAREQLMLVGLDVIGDWLIEVNTTCPTGIPVVERLYGLNLAKIFWDAVEAC